MSEKFYLWLLNLYPSRFRDEYGDAMRQVFRDRLRTEPLLRLWFDVLRDLAISVPKEHRRPAATASEPGVYRLSEHAVRKIMSRAHGSPSSLALPLVAGVLIAWVGGAPPWLLAIVYGLLTLFLLAASLRSGMKNHWRGYEVVLEDDRISYRNDGVVQVAINRSEITLIQESGGYGLAIVGAAAAPPLAPSVHVSKARRGPRVFQNGPGQPAIWAPAGLTGYAELRERLAAWVPVAEEPVQPHRGRIFHRKHLQMFVAAFYVSALLVRSHYWVFGLASICGAFLIFVAAMVLRDAGLPRFLKLIPFGLLLLLAIKIVFALA